MPLKPLPDLENAEAMTKLGRLSALRNARLDAIEQLRNVVTRLNSREPDYEAEIEAGRAALDRIEEVVRLEA